MHWLLVVDHHAHGFVEACSIFSGSGILGSSSHFVKLAHSESGWLEVFNVLEGSQDHNHE